MASNNPLALKSAVTTLVRRSDLTYFLRETTGGRVVSSGGCASSLTVEIYKRRNAEFPCCATSSPVKAVQLVEPDLATAVLRECTMHGKCLFELTS
jgi:hypothetical protein